MEYQLIRKEPIKRLRKASCLFEKVDVNSSSDKKKEEGKYPAVSY